ncbi:MAG TPA: DUF6600 domain-containing protein [Candidatus Acidoferrales bacterium]|nr:DUF6600 domain-containing protein [Candidatus Acidoferrales bacterium]
MKNLVISFALLAAGLAVSPQSTYSQDFSKIRIVRLSLVEGNVEYQRPGQDWQDATLNLPIEEGFALRTTDGYAEVEFEDALALRLATNTTVEFKDLSLQDGGRLTRLSVPQGTAMVSAKLRRGDAVTVISGNMTMNPQHSARFRVDVSPSESFVTAFHGKVEIDSGEGKTALLSGGHTLHESANGSLSTEIANNPPQDDFDKWVSHREEAVNVAQNETSAVLGTNTYTEGYADLYNYGIWSSIPGYGYGWMPYGLGAGWMPFMSGQWLFMGGLGWNWVSSEPWGWVPYHFGSWVNVPGSGWAWVPVGSNSWRPATASWVQVNNQLGWIPNGPPLSSKPTKAQLAAIPSTAILAAQGSSGAIKAGTQIPLTKLGMMVRASAAPAPSFVASSALARQSVTRQSESVSASATHARVIGAPASLRAPNVSTSQLQVAKLSSMPHAVMAPHSAPAPAIARGASFGGMRGSYGGPSGGSGSAGTMGATSTVAPATSMQGPSAGATSRSGGSAGTSGTHR